MSGSLQTRIDGNASSQTALEQLENVERASRLQTDPRSSVLI